MVFITGDTHIPIDINWLVLFSKKYPSLTKKDYVIVAGDFGGCWDEKNLKFTEEIMKTLPFTLLFIDGNHENFNILNSYKIEEWNGGKVHKLFDDVIHLMRGEIFNIEGKTFLTIGGAESIDKGLRIENISWWKDETIKESDIQNALNNLKKVNNKVDYVITHTMPQNFLMYPPFITKTYGVGKESERMLDIILNNIEYKAWFFGHWHTDKRVYDNIYAVYHDVYLIDKEIECIDYIEYEY